MGKADLEFNTQPVPAARPRVFRNGGVAYPKAHTEYKEYLKRVLRDHKANPYDGLIEVRFLFVMPPYKGSPYPTHRSDLDNLAKLPMDCLTQSENFWVDDSLIVSLIALKRFARAGETPHTKVRITHIDGDIGEYTDKVFLQ